MAEGQESYAWSLQRDEPNSEVLTYGNIKFAPGDEITIFGKTYVYQQLLGVGGYTYAFLVKDTNGKNVVIKGLHVPKNKKEKVHNQWHYNVHDSIATRAQLGKCDGMIDYEEQRVDDSAVVVEYVNGANLHSICAGTYKLLPYPESIQLDKFLDTIVVLRDLYATVLQCEQRESIHGDIKPANVMISRATHSVLHGLPEGMQSPYFQTVLIDLDLLKTKDMASLYFETYKGETYGTAKYMSPEQCQGRCTIGTDRWNIARVTREMLVGFPDGYRGGTGRDTMIDLVRTGRVAYSPAQENRMRNLHQLKELAPVERAARNLPLILDTLEHPDPDQRLRVKFTPEELVHELFYGGNPITV